MFKLLNYLSIQFRTTQQEHKNLHSSVIVCGDSVGTVVPFSDCDVTPHMVARKLMVSTKIAIF